MIAMKTPAKEHRQASAIDRRILASVERHGEYLGLTEWLEKYGREPQSEPVKRATLR